MKRIAIVGGGVAGRTLALELGHYPCEVHIWDPDPSGQSATGYQAGGMLAPFSEREHCDEALFQLGLASLKLWPRLAKVLGDDFPWCERGSLLIAHHRDRPLWQEVSDKITAGLDLDQFSKGPASQWEPELTSNFGFSLFLPQESHLDPRKFFSCSNRVLAAKGVHWHPQHIQDIPHYFSNNPLDFDWVVDCRGLGARETETDLRGVRGESVVVEAKDVNISRPIRMMHPRYSLYIVPRGSHQYYLGATQVEREDEDPITIRSALELLSAAFSSHRGFGEGHIVELVHGLRPSYFHHRPEIRVRGSLLSLNGLFRHGFLLAPILSQVAATFMMQTQLKPDDFDLIRILS